MGCSPAGRRRWSCRQALVVSAMVAVALVQLADAQGSETVLGRAKCLVEYKPFLVDAINQVTLY